MRQLQLFTKARSGTSLDVHRQMNSLESVTYGHNGILQSYKGKQNPEIAENRMELEVMLSEISHTQ